MYCVSVASPRGSVIKVEISHEAEDSDDDQVVVQECLELWSKLSPVVPESLDGGGRGEGVVTRGM